MSLQTTSDIISGLQPQTPSVLSQFAFLYPNLARRLPRSSTSRQAVAYLTPKTSKVDSKNLSAAHQLSVKTTLTPKSKSFENNIKSDEFETLKKQLIDLSASSEVGVLDVVNVLSQFSTGFKIKNMLSFLWRQSLSLNYITGESIKSHLLPKLDKQVVYKSSKMTISKYDNNMCSPTHSIIKRNSSNVDKRVIKHTFTNETNQSEKNTRRKQVIFRIADELFARSQTLMDILHHKVYDKVVDGKEYQIVLKADLLQSFRRIGIDFDDKDKKYLNDMLIPLHNNYIDVKAMVDIMGDLGIYEDVPRPTAQLDYSQLEGPTIRIWNRIVRYMKQNDINDMNELIQPNEVDMLNIVSKDKEHVVRVVQKSKFEDILLSKDIIRHRGQLEDRFIELVQLSPDHSDVLTLKKLQRLISKIQKHKYFRFFGFEMRALENRKEQHKAITMNKRHSHMINPEYLSQNLGFESEIKNVNSNNSDNVNKKIKVTIYI